MTLSNEEVGQYIQSMIENARQFSWDRTARETLDVYKSVAS